ncbi:MAG: sigma-70 family RNA polymerase sigma factor [Terriglobales bacterium]
MQEVTMLLKRLGSGDKAALDEIIPLVYAELRRIAQGYLRRESPGNTLQPTALIHEAYLRMVRQSHPDYASRAHFYGISARIMRQILVDNARQRHAKKRASEQTIALSEVLEIAGQPPHGVIVLDEALNRLSAIDERKSNLVEMRFFGGMTAEEIAECACIPVHTVRRELRIAQAWLRKELSA